jgi:diadenylate cyclase
VREELHNFLLSLQSYAWWQIALQLLIIGSIVFAALRFLQGTRGARMLKGVAFLVIAMFLVVKVLSNRSDFAPLFFLYERFLGLASIAILVAFAPELRRGLVRLGETRLFRTGNQQIAGQVEPLIESARFLAKRRYGALVAIEREASLGSLAENGTKIDAAITPELLNTIFWPGTPLHDLGVVISGGRVAYANVQFPLAEVGDLDRDLGSRHRAAVGLSQEFDAVILVVSEQSGDISIADRGRLYRRLDWEVARDLLVELLNTKAGPVQGASVDGGPAQGTGTNTGEQGAARREPRVADVARVGGK